ncbi:MAG: TIM barrel protein [Mangrovibacterium sp.]|jgi:sugar phosphate isomerase/epimerase|nr:TIM barrel protein [Mangrovibacterium sp.]
MKLGISSYSFTWAAGVAGYYPEKRLNELELIDLAKYFGVALVQIADNMPLHEMSEERLGILLKKATDNRIEVEVGANMLTSSRLERYIELAEKLQSGILRFAIDGTDYRPGIHEVISIIGQAEPELKERRITLALENHDRLFAADFLKIIEKVNSPYVGICLDCANSLGLGEGFREVVSALAPHTVNFHLKEVNIQRKYHKMGFDVEGKPFGEGCLPLDWMLKQLPPKCKTAILEQWTPPGKTIEETIAKEKEWAGKSILYLRKYFNE